MESISTLVKISLPKYLENLPLPNSISGFSKLSVQDWLSLIPFVGTVSLVVYVTSHTFQQKWAKYKKSGHGCRINYLIKPECEKVVDIEDIEDLGEKVAYCRCWKSKKFPYCDGAHSKHNQETGDNVGPVVLKRKDPNPL